MGNTNHNGGHQTGDNWVWQDCKRSHRRQKQRVYFKRLCFKGRCLHMKQVGMFFSYLVSKGKVQISQYISNVNQNDTEKFYVTSERKSNLLACTHVGLPHGHASISFCFKIKESVSLNKNSLQQATLYLAQGLFSLTLLQFILTYLKLLCHLLPSKASYSAGGSEQHY